MRPLPSDRRFASERADAAVAGAFDTAERRLLHEQLRRFVARESSGLKALAGEFANDVTYACQQFHGGMGYIRHTMIARLWCDARILAIGGGAPEVMFEQAAERL